MEASAFSVMADSAEEHWWWQGRRRVLKAILDQVALAPDPAILEIGTGTGTNLPLLAQYGRTWACEIDSGARAIAAARGLGPVNYGALPDDLPFAGTRFDLIALLDVIEHIENDVAALAAVRGRLTPRGKILITVPALPWMWSRLDETAHHHRRYARGSLRDAVQRAGLQVESLNYFNTLLLPAAIAQRVLDHLRIAKYDADMLKTPSRPVNRVFTTVFAFEGGLVTRVPLPIGLSLVAVASDVGN